MSTVRVYFNGRGVDAPREGTVLDAARVGDPALAGQLEHGTRALTDSRGLGVPLDAPVYNGAIFRSVSARPQVEGEA